MAVTIGESIISGTNRTRRLMTLSCKAHQFVELYPINVNYVLCTKCRLLISDLLPFEREFLDNVDTRCVGIADNAIRFLIVEFDVYTRGSVMCVLTREKATKTEGKI